MDHQPIEPTSMSCGCCAMLERRLGAKPSGAWGAQGCSPPMQELLAPLLPTSELGFVFFCVFYFCSSFVLCFPCCFLNVVFWSLADLQSLKYQEPLCLNTYRPWTRRRGLRMQPCRAILTFHRCIVRPNTVICQAEMLRMSCSPWN